MKNIVKHRKTNERYFILGSCYDGSRGLLYKLIKEDIKPGVKYFYDRQTEYMTADKRRR